ncbi:MAG: hypothetical protein WD100_04060, partial [Tistlia sp.]
MSEAETEESGARGSGASGDGAGVFPLAADPTPYRQLDAPGDGLVGLDRFAGEDMLTVEPEALRLLSEQAFIDINHFLRPGHLQQLRDILDDPEA